MSSLSSDKLYPITVVGAGPIGLLFSLLLSNHLYKKEKTTSRPPIIILEKASSKSLSSPMPDGRTVALTYRTVQLLKELSLWSSLEKEAEPILDILVTEGLDHEGVHYDHKSIGEPFGYIVENYLLRKSLYEAVTAQKNILLCSQTSLESLDNKEASLSLTLSNNKTIETQVLIGADGRTSKVRTLQHFENYILPYSQKAIVCRISHPFPHRGWALEAFFPEGPFATLPLKGTTAHPHQSGLVWCESIEKSAFLSSCSIEEFEEALSKKWSVERYGPPTLLNERWVYPLSAMILPSFIKSRTALLGDAAHGIHPVAGQGLNLGIKDVILLADKISQALHLGLDPGSPTLLKAYERGRRFDTLSLFATTHGLLNLFGRKERPMSFLRRTGLRIVDHIPSLKKALMYEAMGLPLSTMKQGVKGEPYHPKPD